MFSPEIRVNDESTRQLDLMRQSLRGQTYPGYPPHEDRLVCAVDSLARDGNGRLVVPYGPWQIDTHPNRHEIAKVPTEVEQELLSQHGYELDAVGRPLHPLFSVMIDDPTIGIVTGKGAYWRWGPNYTVDPLVIWRNHLLLIQRGDTGTWALPGGFIDHYELAAHAGNREVQEETGVKVPANIEPRFVYQGLVADMRTTANAWAETSALLYEVPDDIELPAPTGMDDAIGAAWVPLDQLQAEPQLFGSHAYLLERACRLLS